MIGFQDKENAVQKPKCITQDPRAKPWSFISSIFGNFSKSKYLSSEVIQEQFLLICAGSEVHIVFSSFFFFLIGKSSM